MCCGPFAAACDPVLRHNPASFYFSVGYGCKTSKSSYAVNPVTRWVGPDLTSPGPEEETSDVEQKTTAAQVVGGFEAR